MKNLMLPLRPKATFVLLFLGSLSFLASCVSDYNNNCDGVTTKFHDLFMDPYNNEAKAIEKLPKSGRSTIPCPFLPFLQKKRSESEKHDLSQTCSTHKVSVLMRAIGQGWTEFIEYVFDSDDYTWGNINHQVRSGVTPLMSAVSPSNPGIAKLLIMNGANVNLKDENGSTALILAAQDNNLAFAKLLCEHGADVDLKDNADKTAEMYADEEGHEAVADFLKEEKRK